jgi:hypothetical protein
MIGTAGLSDAPGAIVGHLWQGETRYYGYYFDPRGTTFSYCFLVPFALTCKPGRDALDSGNEADFQGFSATA